MEAHRSRGANIALAVAGIAFLLFGLLLLYAGWEIWQPFWASASWDVAPGKVLSVELREHASSASDRPSGSTWEVVCSCRFEADGQPVPCTRVTPTHDISSPRAPHDRRLDALERHRQEGTPVPVWVNPDDPSDCFVLREASSAWYYFVGFGGPLTLLGCCLMVVPAVDGGFFYFAGRGPHTANVAAPGFRRRLIACDLSPHRGGRNVLTGDGWGRWLSETAFRAALAEPHNAAFANALRAAADEHYNATSARHQGTRCLSHARSGAAGV